MQAITSQTRFQMAGAPPNVPILVFDHGIAMNNTKLAAATTGPNQPDEDIDAISHTSSTMSDDESSWTSSEDEYMEGVDDSMIGQAGGVSHGLTSMLSCHSLDAFFLQAQRAGVLQPGLSTANGMVRTNSSTSLGLLAVVRNQVTHGVANCSVQTSMTDSSTTLFSAPGMIVQTTSAQDPTDDSFTSLTRPEDHFQTSILKGMTARVSYAALGSYFTPMTPENVAAWESDMIRAIRQQDLATLKTICAAGRSMHACNQFGETLLHVCVRRGSRDLLRFLLEECGVSPRVCCENGRTPAHDALWCGNFDMLDLLLSDAPELLLIQDKRNHTPLDYVPRSQWAKACQFLDDHAHRLKLHQLIQHPILQLQAATKRA